MHAKVAKKVAFHIIHAILNFAIYILPFLQPTSKSKQPSQPSASDGAQAVKAQVSVGPMIILYFKLIRIAACITRSLHVGGGHGISFYDVPDLKHPIDVLPLSYHPG